MGSDIIKNMTEAQSFWTIFYSQFSQIIDTLLTCSYLGLTPYIRYEVTFNYLALIMNTFFDDKNLRSMIEKTIVFYIFYRTIDKERLEGIDFTEYCKRLDKKPSLIEKILNIMQSQGIDISKGGIKSVENIISSEFESIII